MLHRGWDVSQEKGEQRRVSEQKKKSKSLYNRAQRPETLMNFPHHHQIHPGRQAERARERTGVEVIVVEVRGSVKGRGGKSEYLK
jgi:hypothetical protein